MYFQSPKSHPKMGPTVDPRDSHRIPPVLWPSEWTRLGSCDGLEILYVGGPQPEFSIPVAP